jgi:hypothetical protein
MAQRQLVAPVAATSVMATVSAVQRGEALEASAGSPDGVRTWRRHVSDKRQGRTGALVGTVTNDGRREQCGLRWISEAAHAVR